MAFGVPAFVVSISTNNHNNKFLTLCRIVCGSCLGLLRLSVGYGLVCIRQGVRLLLAVNSFRRVTLPIFYKSLCFC